MNKDNTRLRPEFEDILRFYGFDFTIDEETNTTNATTTENMPETTTMRDEPMSTLQAVRDDITTMNPNGTLGNDTDTITSSVTTDLAVTTLPSVDETVPLATDLPTTIDTSVDIVNVTQNNPAAIIESTTASTTGSTNSPTITTSSSVEILETPLNSTDLPTRFSSLPAPRNLSTEMIVNDPESVSGSTTNVATEIGSEPVTTTERATTTGLSTSGNLTIVSALLEAN